METVKKINDNEKNINLVPLSKNNQFLDKILIRHH